MFLETVEFNIHEKLNLIKIKKNGVDPFDFSLIRIKKRRVYL